MWVIRHEVKIATGFASFSLVDHSFRGLQA
jgi:hypothetical protein